MATPEEPTPASLEGQQNQAEAQTDHTHPPATGDVVDLTEKPKEEKKKKKKKTSKAKKRGTGFEEFYCDAPMTPAEHSQETEVIYAPHRPFVDRIEECIQRFRARRRLSSEREYLFSRYLYLGGIDASVRQFQSTRNIENDALEEASKSSVREMTADDVIQRGGEGNHNPRYFNPNYPEHWDVDFTGVVTGYLSEHLPQLAGGNYNQFSMGVDVILNFLKYVDRHEVCPEYADDLKKAQRICKQALGEMPAITELTTLLPGPFNTALGILHKPDQGKDTSDFDTSFGGEKPMDHKTAKIIYAVALSTVMGSKQTIIPAESSIVDTNEMTIEVRGIQRPNDATRAKYQTVNRHLTGYPDMQPCGTITTRPVVVRDGWDNSATATIPPEADKDHNFILEDDILRLLKLGMTLTMTVHTLSSGLEFIKCIREIRPTYYLFLPQELMLQYKEPVPNERPARSIYDDEDAGGMDGPQVDEKDI
ncbi:Argonaute complex, subunit Arb1 [Dichotomopilus funicola]|uniref:Argonaute complex, subunit Arb1 n=1 Tax=Dichotomopilus funicola TaxID=1934379 RepID=A0AAN6V789_9PEZI|nr:Argonaute complex, subunit Arb1 [Dichotomopilus funicola]